MLDNLLEIEVAYSLLKSEDDAENEDPKAGKTKKDPIDAHYDKLKTKMEVLDRASDEFKLLEKYAANTHAKTHTMYTLEIEQVRVLIHPSSFSVPVTLHLLLQIFKISRKGEAKRFDKYRKLDNRMLLWHGSRTTNFAGILSQVFFYF